MSANKANGQGQMMMVGVSSLACCCLLAVAGGALFMFKGGASSPPMMPPPPVDSPASDTGGEDTSGSTDLSGLRRIKYGSSSLVAANKKCTDKRVWFADTADSDSHLWSFIPVPNKPDTYYIQSEMRLFRKGCPVQYLTGPADRFCKQTATLDKPVYLDRQQWKVVPNGDTYQIVNVGCENRRAGAFMISSGNRTGNDFAKNRTPNFMPRAGSPYTIEGQ